MTDVRLGELGNKWREDAEYPISKHAHPIDRETMAAVKQDIMNCVRELESALARLRAEAEMWPHDYSEIVIRQIRQHHSSCHRCCILREIEVSK